MFSGFQRFLDFSLPAICLMSHYITTRRPLSSVGCARKYCIAFTHTGLRGRRFAIHADTCHYEWKPNRLPLASMSPPRALLLSRVSTPKKKLNYFQFPKQEKKTRKKHKKNTKLNPSHLDCFLVCSLACFSSPPSSCVCIFSLCLLCLWPAGPRIQRCLQDIAWGPMRCDVFLCRRHHGPSSGWLPFSCVCGDDLPFSPLYHLPLPVSDPVAQWVCCP